MTSYKKKNKSDVDRSMANSLRSDIFRKREHHVPVDPSQSAEFESADASRSFRELTKIFAENGAIKPSIHTPPSVLFQQSLSAAPQPTAKQARVHKALLARGQTDVTAGGGPANFPFSYGTTSISSTTARFRQFRPGDLVSVQLPDETVQCTVVRLHSAMPDDVDNSAIAAFLSSYYTVSRNDTGHEIRADPDSMDLLWSRKSMYASCCRCVNPVVRAVIQTARNFLYGVYVAKFRCTWINTVTLASFWILVVDQARLAFLPPAADSALAIVQWIVWLVLVTELVLEAFVRPIDYRQSLKSEKAFTPRTVRFMHGTQWLAEAVALALFVPEFQCIFTQEFLAGPSTSCSKAYPLQFHRGAVLAIMRHSRAQIVAGYAMMSLTRLRVLALVRRWKNRVTGGTAGHVPTQPSASTIGTAIMATHAQSAAIGLLAIVAGLPLLLAVQQRTSTSDGMTGLLHMWTASSVSCEFWELSLLSWLETSWRDGLISVEVYPPRCTTSTVVTSLGACTSTLQGLICLNDDYINSTIRAGSIAEYSIKSNGLVNVNGTSILTENSIVARFDETASVRLAAIASLLLQIGLVILILGGLSVMRRDAEHLVLGPLRRMLKIVSHYAKNPLVRPRIKRLQSKRPRMSGRMSTNASDDSDTLSFGSDDEPVLEVGNFETEQLITAVAKITDLLRKCWGVAGADIISTNLATQEGALTEVFNPTVPGRSVYALFGFVAIGEFDNAVRNLGGDIMPLINDIAAVLHGEVARWGFGDSGGECNKNLGGAFLMVFRIGLVTEVIAKLEQATDVVFSTGSFKSNSTMTGPKKRQARRTSDESVNPTSDRLSNANRRKGQQPRSTTNAMSLSLQSLPGISTFTDRAVIGMLKSFAGIHRDHKILDWNDDFRLGAGVGAFHISMVFGMDAGWAVEGAVGSEYKIDATYLSPHVNNASRMTGACKQYDVTIMLSQAVQELMSENAQQRLRHLDTVTVKGSSMKQKIYTYDARARGVDFFQFSRTEEQAEFDADRYQPTVWNTDPDLIAMRQHVTDDFLYEFNQGHKAYLAGEWSEAIEFLEKANNIMFQRAVDEGCFEDDIDALNIDEGEDVRGAADEIRRENSDGPSLYLLNYMKSFGGVAPKTWDGWHPLTRK